MKRPKNQRVAFWLDQARDLAILILIGNVISFLFNPDLEHFWERIKWGSFYSLFIGGILWKGNQFIGFYLGRKIDIHDRPYRSLAWNLTAMFIFSLVTIVVVNYIWFVIIFDWTAERLFTRGLITMLIVFFVTVIITSIFYSIGFFKAWKESAVNEERLQKESIRLQYEALRNQVNPHFLFNSLNSLTSLVHQDQDEAVRFIKHLSEVYRYVLEHKDSELVPLADEIRFTERYISLQKIRHGDSLKVSIAVQDPKGRMVVPVSMQVLVENAIKHNVVSEEHPLEIGITDIGDALLIRNNLQPRKTLNESGGIGLNSLKARYAFITDRPVVARQTTDNFEVELPFIKSTGA
jgi:hypothetical protein